MKWSLPLSIGAVFVASLAYLHLVPAQKADGTNCCVSGTKSEAPACCTEGASCCAAGAACCETASAKTEGVPCFVASETKGCGDALQCFDVVEHETVDSILAKASAALELTAKDVWVSGLGDDAASPERTLQTNFLEMSEGIDPATNYQIIPYDRIFIKDHDRADQ